MAGDYARFSLGGHERLFAIFGITPRYKTITTAPCPIMQIYTNYILPYGDLVSISKVMGLHFCLSPSLRAYLTTKYNQDAIDEQILNLIS